MEGRITNPQGHVGTEYIMVAFIQSCAHIAHLALEYSGVQLLLPP